MGRLWQTHLVAAGVVIAAYPSFPLGLRPWVFDALSLAAGVAMLIAIRVRRFPRPLPWLFIAGAQLSFAAGDVAFDYLRFVLHVEPFPSVADAAYATGYVLLGAGLTLLIRRRCQRGDMAGLLDAAMVTVGVGVTSWLFLIVPIATDSSLGLVDRLVSVGYPLADLLLLALLIRLGFTPARSAAASRLLAVGVLAQLIADTGYAAGVLVELNTIGSTGLDMLWLAAYALTLAAILHPAASALDTSPPERGAELSVYRVAALAVAALVAPLILTVQSVADVAVDGLVIGIASIILFLLVIARMVGLFRHVQDQARQLSALAGTDGLTGIANRRRWDDTLPAELARAARTREPVCVALIDLDHFKAYNDTHGHQSGDDLLRRAAATWRAQARSVDLVARYGGEEFAVLLPDCTLHDARKLTQRLHDGVPDGQTCSIGLAQWDRLELPADLIGRADAALYQAKHQGRNRTQVSGDVPSPCPSSERPHDGAEGPHPGSQQERALTVVGC